MTPITRFAVAAGAAVTIVAGALWLAPLLLAEPVWRWAAAELEASTKVRVSASGPIRLQLLPAPRLLVSDVQASQGSVGVARAAGLTAKIGALALLQGQIEIEQATVRQLRLAGVPSHPPVDLVLAMKGAALQADAAFEGGRLIATGRRSENGYALESFDLRALGVGAQGSGAVTLDQGARMVLNAERIAYQGSEIGRGALAATAAADGLLIERAALRLPGGVELALFGLGSSEAGGLRFEGGLEAQAAGTEASARLAGSLAEGRAQLEVNDIAGRSGDSRLSGRVVAQHAQSWKAVADLRLDQADIGAFPLAGMIAAPLLGVSDLELRLRIGRLAWTGNAAEGIVLDLLRAGSSVTIQEFAVRSLAGTPARVTGRATIAAGPRLVFDTLNLKWGAAELSGLLEADLAASPLQLAADLKSAAPLGYDSFFPPLPPLPPEPMTRRAAAAQAAAPRLPPRREGWDTTPFSLPTLPPADISLRLAAPALLWRGLRLDDGRLALRLASGELVVEQLAGMIYGGRFEGRGRATLTDGRPSFEAASALTGADLKQVLAAQAGINEISGRVDATLDGKARGRSAAELIASLEGRVGLKGSDGQLTGFDLPAMSNGLKRLNRPTDLFEVVRLGLGGGRTAFTRLEGSFTVQSGVARTDDLRLIAAAGQARTVGAINLPAWTLDLTNELRLSEHADLPPLVFKLNGSIDAPLRVFDIAALQAQLVRRGRR